VVCRINLELGNRTNQQMIASDCEWGKRGNPSATEPNSEFKVARAAAPQLQASLESGQDESRL
jgi:hypothetical protein